MKVLCLLQARMNSSRLPGKVMKILIDHPIIFHIIKSISFCKLIDEFVVVTTDTMDDDKLVDFLMKNNLKYFRGDEIDVLNRFYSASEQFHGDVIVRLTADNPLIDPRIVDDLIQHHLDTNADYSSNTSPNLPLGYTVEVMSKPTLDLVHRKATTSSEKEHVTSYIPAHKSDFKINYKQIPAMDYSWRLTVDTIEDYNLITKIFAKLYVKNSFIKFEDVFALLTENPDLTLINSHIKQNH